MKLSPLQHSRLWLALVTLALASPLLWTLLQDGTFVGNGTDLFSYQLPMRRGAASLIASGEWPWWNPYVLGGVAAHVGMQLGLCYAPNLLTLLWPGGGGVALLLALHIAWMALGAAALASAHRGQRASWQEVTVAAAVLAGGGPLWGHLFAGHVNWVQALSWMPWVWACGLHALTERRSQPLLWGAAALGMALLAGHPQVVYLGMVGLGAVLLAHALDPVHPPAQAASRWQRAPASLVALAVLASLSVGALALAAVQWLPTARMAPELNRQLDTPLQIASAFSAPARSLWTFVAPSVWGGAQARLASFSYHETVAFCGAGAATLALVALLLGGVRSWVLGASAALLVLVSLGSEGPLLESLVGLLPGVATFRVPGRWLLAACLIVGLLAVDGAALLSAWVQQRPKNGPITRRNIALAVLGLVALGLLSRGLACRADAGWWGELILDPGRDPIPIASRVRDEFVVAALACGLAAACLLRPAWAKGGVVVLAVGTLLQGLLFASSHVGAAQMKTTTQVQWSPEEVSALRLEVGERHRLATAGPLRQADWGMAAGVRVSGGYEPVLTREANRYANAMAGLPSGAYAVNFQVRRPSVWLDRMATSHVLLDAKDRATARAFAAWPEVAHFDSGRVLRRNPRPMDRLAFAAHTQYLASVDGAHEVLPTLDADTVLLDAPWPQPQSAAGTVEIVGETPTRLALRATSSGAATLIIRDAWAPGWSAQVDGAPARTARADGLFRAVLLSPGTHQIVWIYAAPGLRVGALASLGAWLLCLGVLGVLIGRRRAWL